MYAVCYCRGRVVLSRHGALGALLAGPQMHRTFRRVLGGGGSTCIAFGGQGRTSGCTAWEVPVAPWYDVAHARVCRCARICVAGILGQGRSTAGRRWGCLP